MEEDTDQFVDAPDEFPFYDCLDGDVESESQLSSGFSNFPASSQASLRRRAQRSFDESASDVSPVTDFKSGTREKRYRRFRSVKQQQQQQQQQQEEEEEEKERKSDQIESSLTRVEVNSESQTVVNQIDDNEVAENVVELGNEGVDAVVNVVDENQFRVGNESVLVFLVDLMIKVTWFQVKLFTGFMTFPLLI